MTTDRKLTWASIAFTILGILDATYLLIFKLSNNHAMCLSNGGCDVVNASRYSEIYGIPVSVFGILAYLAILATLVIEPHWQRHGQRAFGIFQAGAVLVGNGQMVGDEIELPAGHPEDRAVVDFHAAKVSRKLSGMEGRKWRCARPSKLDGVVHFAAL